MVRKFFVVLIGSILVGLVTLGTYNVLLKDGDGAWGGGSLGEVPSLDVSAPPSSATNSRVIDQSETQAKVVTEDVLRASYEPLIPFTFGNLTMLASIAQTTTERTRGLSDTISLPDDIAKVFVFESSSKYGFWMKDMNYPIDIVWVDEAGGVVHIESNVAPETYPKSFAPTRPARVVIEVVSGGAAAAGIEVGSQIDITPFVANL